MGESDRYRVAEPGAAGLCSYSQGLYGINKAVFSKGAHKYSGRKKAPINHETESRKVVGCIFIK